jgi:hypothetical protein
VVYFRTVDLNRRVVVVESYRRIHVSVPVLGFVGRHAIRRFGGAETVEPIKVISTCLTCVFFPTERDLFDRDILRVTYLCTSPAAGPTDRHSRTTSAKNPRDSKNRGFFNICTTCRGCGSRAFVAFHEYPFAINMLIGELLPPFGVSSSSPLACEMRTDTERSRRLSVLLRFRWTCRVEDLGGGEESSFAVGAPERRSANAGLDGEAMATRKMRGCVRKRRFCTVKGRRAGCEWEERATGRGGL